MARWSKKTVRWIALSFAFFLLAGALGLGAQIYFRWQEAKGYEDAPACAGAEAAKGTSATCKLVTEATYDSMTCPPRHAYYCDFAFKVPIDGATATRSVTARPGIMEKLKAGDRVRLELYQGHITRVSANGELAAVTGTPAFAFNTMAFMVPLALIVGLVLLRAGLRVREG
jgi:hypothetical protein